MFCFSNTGTKTAATALTFESVFNRSEMAQWQDLEEMSVLVAGKHRKLPDTYRPSLQLLHGNTDNSNNPLAVIKGKCVKHRKLPDTYRPSLQLLHGNTDNSNNPLAVIKGKCVKHRKLPDTYRPSLQLLHGNTDNSNNPLAVIKGKCVQCCQNFRAPKHSKLAFCRGK